MQSLPKEFPHYLISGLYLFYADSAGFVTPRCVSILLLCGYIFILSHQALRFKSTASKKQQLTELFSFTAYMHTNGITQTGKLFPHGG